MALSNQVQVSIVDQSSWIPASGQVGFIPALNTFASVDPCPSDSCIYNQFSNGIGNEHVIDAWNAVTYSPFYSTNGALVLHGGGHGDYGGNETYVFDFDTLLFKRLDNPTTNIDRRVTDIVRTVSNMTYCEYADGQPASSHTYDNLCIIPPGKGGGAKGSLLRVVSNACGAESAQTGYSHIFDLNNPSARWSRFSTNAFNNNAVSVHGYGCYDPLRNCVWQWNVNGAAGLVGKLDIATKTWTMIPIANSPAPAVDSAFAQYYAARDIIVIGGANSTLTTTHFWYFDPKNISLGAIRATKSASIPPSSSSFVGGDICQDNGKLYVITPSGQSEDGVYEVTIPATLSDVWNVTFRSWVGDPAAVSMLASGIDLVKWYGKRFHYCSKLKCFFFLGAGRGYTPVAFRPVGV